MPFLGGLDPANVGDAGRTEDLFFVDAGAMYPAIGPLRLCDGSPLSTVLPVWRTWGFRAVAVAGVLACGAGCSTDTSDSPHAFQPDEATPISELTVSDIERLRELLDACPGLEDMNPELIPPDVAHEALPIPDPEPLTVCPVLEDALP